MGSELKNHRKFKWKLKVISLSKCEVLKKLSVKHNSKLTKKYSKFFLSAP